MGFAKRLGSTWYMVIHPDSSKAADHGQTSQLNFTLHSGSDDSEVARILTGQVVRRERPRQAGAPRSNVGGVHNGQRMAGLQVVEHDQTLDGGRLARKLRVHLDSVGRYSWDRAGEKDHSGRGLWSEAASEATDKPDTQVYVTNTGKKYHTAICRYLSKSMIPISLSEARARYEPCSVCSPPISDRSGTASTAPSATAAPRAPPETAVTVYVTRTGSKYHRAGCRYLSKSSTPMKLPDASRRYGACSVCKPPRQ